MDVDATIEVMVASVMGNAIAADVFVLDAGVATAICAVPTDTISAAGTVAISCAGLV